MTRLGEVLGTNLNNVELFNKAAIRTALAYCIGLLLLVSFFGYRIYLTYAKPIDDAKLDLAPWNEDSNKVFL